MSISFDTAFGNHTQALRLHGKRMELLAANLANADTPGFKAKDIDFRSVLNEAQSKVSPVTLTASRDGHFGPQIGVPALTAMYRVPAQASLDGNTVETQIEQAKFAENSLQYQISMQFVSGTIKGLLTAIRGE
ncbi:MAG: flagellar basal body rod protein FlgB [Methylococcaceae bacterium]|nr:flagellar basal body rod protein FlgB [Methylococcaceae bacterium]